MDRIYAEEVINHEKDLHKLYVWSESVLREMIANKIDDVSDEAIEPFVQKIKNGEEVKIISHGSTSKFRIASQDEIKSVFEYEDERAKEDSNTQEGKQFLNTLDEMFNSQFNKE